MKYFIKDRWWTELGRQIKLNDLLNDMRECCRELNQLHSKSTLEDAVRIAHSKGFRLRVKLSPNESVHGQKQHGQKRLTDSGLDGKLKMPAR
jgi:hypothetical protein